MENIKVAQKLFKLLVSDCHHIGIKFNAKSKRILCPNDRSDSNVRYRKIMYKISFNRTKFTFKLVYPITTKASLSKQ